MAYTTIDDGSKYFQSVLWRGDDETDRAITNTGNSDLQPDWVWIKCTNDTFDHVIVDSSRGASTSTTGTQLSSNLNAAEPSNTNGHVKSFNSDGFNVRSGSSAGNPLVGVNKDAKTYVAWQWKANGGTTTTNDASATSVGSIDSVYQANTTAGFSIVTYTGTGSNGTIAHGLGSTPKWYFVKNRSESSVSSTDQAWIVYHSVMGHGAAMFLNTTDSKMNHSPFWNSTAPTSTTFSVGTDSRTNTSADNYIAYCFSEVQGYSKFGSYTGNANDDGPFLYTGFKPKFAIFKASSAGGEGWAIRDSARDPFNQMSGKISANVSATEGTTADDNDCDFLSNGIKLRSNDNQMNKTGTTFIYIAFAEHPFVSSEGVPVTAR